MEKRKGASAEGTMARTSEQDFRILFTTHPTPMWVYDPETLHFIVMNDAAYQLYGYTADEIPGMTVLDIRPQAERDRMLAAIRDRSDLERPERWQHLCANGEIIDVLTYGRQIVFDGRPTILAIVQDRTELTQANRQASHAQSLLDSLVNNLPLGVFVRTCTMKAATCSIIRPLRRSAATRWTGPSVRPTAKSFRSAMRSRSPGRTGRRCAAARC